MRKSSDALILSTGISAWLLLAFAAIKLSVIYARNPFVAYLLAYNISSVVFLLYFIGYFKQRFGFGYLLLLVVTYNIGINILHFIYNELFLLRQPSMEFHRALASATVNLLLMVIMWAALYLFIKPRSK